MCNRSGNNDLGLSQDLLKGVADSIEERNRKLGGFNHFLVRYAGEACKLLGFTVEEQRFERLLATLTPESYWVGAITNLDTTNLPPGAIELSSLASIEQEYPPFSEDYPYSTLQQMGGHLSHCLDRNYERAFAEADNELAKEEVTLAQALLGDYRLATDSLKELSEDYRRRDVILVIAIELYRKGRKSEAQEYRHKLPNAFLSDWGGAHLAVGAANRIPWQLYPFADY